MKNKAPAKKGEEEACVTSPGSAWADSLKPRSLRWAPAGGPVAGLSGSREEGNQKGVIPAFFCPDCSCQRRGAVNESVRCGLALAAS